MTTGIPPWRGGRVVECVRLEIGCPKRTVGSNPTLSVQGRGVADDKSPLETLTRTSPAPNAQVLHVLLKIFDIVVDADIAIS